MANIVPATGHPSRMPEHMWITYGPTAPIATNTKVDWYRLSSKRRAGPIISMLSSNR